MTFRTVGKWRGMRTVRVPEQERAAVPWWVRFTLSALVGVFFAVALGRLAAPHDAADLTPVLRAARMVLLGRSPYDMPVMLYPLPGIVVVTPLALLPTVWAYTLWSGLGAALLTWAAIGRFGLHGLAVVLSKSAARALALAQWSPWYFLGGLNPGWQLLAAAKPTLGLIVWCYRPSRWAFVSAAGLLAISFVLVPTWLPDWVHHTRGATAYGPYAPAAAVWKGGGPLLLLAALRWRRREGRLLLAMALVPQNFIWYDQLLLFLVPTTAVEVWALSLLSWVSSVVAANAFTRAGIPEPAGQMAFQAPIVALMYLPCLAMTLRRPNEGSVPAWLEERIASWPGWLRGAAGAHS